MKAPHGNYAHHINLFKPHTKIRLGRTESAVSSRVPPISVENPHKMSPKKPHVYHSYPILMHQIYDGLPEHEQQNQIPKPNNPEFKNIFLHKLNLGCQVFSDMDPNQRLAKRIVLHQVAECIITLGIGPFIDSEMTSKVYEMIYVNIKRPVPKFELNQFLNSDSGCFSVPEWEHLEFVYTIFQIFYKTFPKLEFWTTQFFESLIPLISSRDTLERDRLAIILSTYYINNPILLHGFALKLAKIIENHFITPDPCAVYTALTIFSNIIASSIENRNMAFNLCNNLCIQLIQNQYLSIFISPFSNLLKMILPLSETLTLILLNGIVKYWPVSDPAKQVPMIKLIIAALFSNHSMNDGVILKKVFLLLGELCDTEFFKVADQACKCLQEEVILGLLSNNCREIVPYIMTHVRSSLKHWYAPLRETAQVTLRVLCQICQERRSDDIGLNVRTSNWVSIARTAAKNDKCINLTKKLGEMSQLFGPSNNSNSQETF
ncbi:hypothetical protein TVAG_087480 [Trichomonas vaginalis G3]|uniref:Phosphoprotein phosphatase n=1 Tax=Trichomonas vaginalis (strain ATCC PRA-98 / G3) TaxID=412133 RepID=A2FDS4_TRIV3|nr:protein phosphatase regulator protein [Trichomonas vaginalis G3]EAX96923.1 hypothetical protein TVAG_087480 [Trichomonas vaginalis G3]KAI5532630.1 protein phosphatase regulator protein [Trichomonas vaginalis G3]|eukprot:XP_001309853.1 hypothetical protein [Trichomonas vaginalis G3]